MLFGTVMPWHNCPVMYLDAIGVLGTAILMVSDVMDFYVGRNGIFRLGGFRVLQRESYIKFGR